MTHAPAIALLMLSAWVQSSPEREIAAWSVLRGVPVKVALAVAEVETGNVPDGENHGADNGRVLRVCFGVVRCVVNRFVDLQTPRVVRGWVLGRDPVDGVSRSNLATRDQVISRGNVGRFQVNATAWCPTLNLPRVECIRALQSRSNNIRVGVAILARMQAKYAASNQTSALSCRCGGRHSWVSHYNAGTLVRAGSRGERYGAMVVYKVRKMGGHEGW